MTWLRITVCAAPPISSEDSAHRSRNLAYFSGAQVTIAAKSAVMGTSNTYSVPSTRAIRYGLASALPSA